MEKLVMRRCCCRCGWSVHKCAVVNALASMIISILIITSCSIELVMNKSGDNSTGVAENTFFARLIRYDPKDEVANKQVMVLSRQVNFVFLFNGIFSLGIAIVSLYGILMRKKEYVLPWLIYNGTSLVGLTFATVVFAVVFPLGLFMFLVIPFYFYMYLIGHSFYFRLAAAEARAAAREQEAAGQRK